MTDRGPAPPEPTARTYIGVFLIALATLMHEILLTRIFSVTMWYHFAFVAVSIAMFGMTVGALIVFLAPRVFPPSGVVGQLALTGTIYPIVIVLSFLTELSVPFIIHPSVVAIYANAFVYFVVSTPFIASGIAICLALTRFPSRVGHLYAADLAGAAVGCVLLVFLLPLTDGPTAVIVVAFLASLAGVLFAADAASRRVRRAAVALSVVLAAAAGGHAVLVARQFPILRILWAKGTFEARPLYERWNSYSRVRVIGDPNLWQTPFARTLSPTFPPDRRERELRVDIDVSASTSMLAFDGDLSKVDFLKYDVTDIGHYLRPADRVLVVGTGGGRDVIAGLVFGATSVTGVEINRQVLEVLNGRFGDFSGHLDRDPRVHFVNDEARSYLARTPDRYDFIQISLIDTWAATAAGAFVLSENSIYTVDAWRIFLNRLTDGGILSVSRWYQDSQPAEVYRLVSLGAASLRAIGVNDPQNHMVLIRSHPLGGVGVGTLLVSRTPIVPQDLVRLDDAVAKLQFETVLSPHTVTDPTISGLVSSQAAGVIASYPLNITAPTDDSPFFFQTLRLRDIFKLNLLVPGKSAQNVEAVFVLGTLLATVIGLSVLSIAVPLAMVADRRVLAGKWALLLFFAAIGLGFMMIETSQMQRLILVLGHPTYGLSVVLFTLLLSGGVGSYITRNVEVSDLGRSGRFGLLCLIAVLIVTGFATPPLTRAFEAASTPLRILVSVMLLSPLGILMGMPFPIGMKLANAVEPRLTPWLWGVNGALSVLASVLAIVVALTITISTAFWMGGLAYVVALAAFHRAARA